MEPPLEPLEPRPQRKHAANASLCPRRGLSSLFAISSIRTLDLRHRPPRQCNGPSPSRLVSWPNVNPLRPMPTLQREAFVETREAL